MPPKSRDTRIEAKKSEAPKEIKKATTQIQKLFDLNGKLLGELLASLSVAKGTGDGLKKNEIEMLNALNNNVVKVQKYIDESQETKDESLRAQSKSIRIRREEVLAKRKKKIPKIENDLEFLFYIWQFDIVAFAEDIFGLWQDQEDARKGLTKQQAEVLDSFSELARYKFIGEVTQGVGLTEEEENLVKKHGIAIRSGKGPGKTFITALLCYWMLICYPNSQVVVYSPKEHQTKQGLWKCFRTLTRMSKVYFEDTFKGQTPLESWVIIREKTVDRLGTGKESKIALGTVNASASPEERGESVAGQHADYQLIAVDEASKVDTRTIQALVDTNSDPMNFLALISNPTRLSGFFYDIWGPAKDYWLPVTWNAEESPRVSATKTKALEQQFGRDSNEYRIGVLGLFPVTNEWQFISWDDCERAFEVIRFEPKPENLIIMGIDPSGGGGGDSYAYVLMQGGKCLTAGKFMGNTKECTAKCLLVARDYSVDKIAIDANGIGKGPYDDFMQYAKYHHFEVHGVISHRRSLNRRQYALVRDEIWLKMREALKASTLDLSWFDEVRNHPLRDELRRAFTRIQLKSDVENRLKLESKREYISNGEQSPDLADALALTFYLNAKLYEPYNNNLVRQEKLYREEHTVVHGPNAWTGF